MLDYPYMKQNRYITGQKDNLSVTAKPKTTLG